MKRNLKKILLSIPGFQWTCRLMTRMHVRALMYHRFCEPWNGVPRFVCGETLQRQLAYISRYHPCWTPDNHHAALSGGRRWEPCPVVVTVDDGYRDFYHVAFPIFRDAGVPVTLFVTTGFVEGKTLLWWDRLEQILEEGKGKRAKVRIDGKEVELHLTGEEMLKRTWNLLADRCRFLPHAAKVALLERLSDAFDAGRVDVMDKRFRAASWDEVRTMAASVVSIGAHTVNHPILSRLDPDEAREEIEGSRRRLEEMGIAAEWFCYPQGGPEDYNPEIQEMVRKAGFKGSYLAYQEIDNSEQLFALPRYCVGEEMVDFQWTLCGAEYLILRLRKLLGRPAKVGDYYWEGSKGLDAE